MPHLEDWSLICDGVNPYMAPELLQPRLCGIVSGHHRVPGGHHVKTSPIKDKNSDTETITTENGTVYTLGQVDARYENMFPGARKRIFK